MVYEAGVRLPVLESRRASLQTLPPRPEGFRTGPLVDAQGRTISYLRLSVTDRCDLACVYCMPPGGEHEHGLRKELLTFEEAARIVRVFSSMGIERVRLTGGEPLIRKDVVDLVRHVAATGAKVVMTTNATRLEALAAPLVDAGLRGVNVSLDSLDPDTFASMTRGGDLAQVLRGILAADAAGLEVKINVVLVRGRTDHEAGRIVDWAWAHGFTPRFIELMPLGEGAKLGLEARVPADEVIAQLRRGLASNPEDHRANHGPARYLKGDGGPVGFITPLSNEFCGTCNRVRVTAQGELRACLASRRAVSLRDVLRGGGSDEDIAWATQWSLTGKAEGHFFLDDHVLEHEHVGMSLIGG